MKLTKTNHKEENKKININDANKHKTGYDLMQHFGVLKGDTEYKNSEKEIKSAWRKWQRRYEKLDS